MSMTNQTRDTADITASLKPDIERVRLYHSQGQST